MQRPNNATRHSSHGAPCICSDCRAQLSLTLQTNVNLTECTIMKIMKIMHLLRLPCTSVTVEKPRLNRADARCGSVGVWASNCSKSPDPGSKPAELDPRAGRQVFRERLSPTRTASDAVSAQRFGNVRFKVTDVSTLSRRTASDAVSAQRLAMSVSR